MKSAYKYAREAGAEENIASFLPYGSHVTEHVVKLTSGDYMASIRMQGAAHESADVRDINTWHEQVNNLLRNIASPNLALWTHVVRREYGEYPAGTHPRGFAADLNAKYRAFLGQQRSLVNELYLTVIYRPQPVRALKLVDLLVGQDQAALEERQLEEIGALMEVVDTALVGLDRYEPELLGCYAENGVMFSEVRELLAFLIDGEWSKQPLTWSDLSHNLATARPMFGRGGTLALKGPARTQYGAILTIQDYAPATCPGLTNALLSLPFEFVLTQSFSFLSRPVALGRMRQQRGRMINAGDVAESQVAAIEVAMDDLASGRIVMGVHHLVMLVRAGSQKDLNDNVSGAGKAFSDTGIKWAREDVSIAGSFWSQLPGNFAYRVRVGDISSRNFAGFSSFHNYPIGHIRHNQWGPAVTAFRTTSGAPYYFSWHKGEEGAEAKRAARLDPNHKDLANTIIVGKSGTGKTALQLFLLAQTLKFNNPEAAGGNRLTAVFFDKDQGAGVGIRAMGGRYYPLKAGVPSGWNPFQLEPTEQNLDFLERLVRRLVHRPDRPLSTAEQKQIHEAIQGVMGVPQHMRRISGALQFLPMGDPEGIHARLARWAGKNAPLGWVFDNEEETLDLAEASVVGFDVTEFLPNDEVRDATIMYLFHRVSTLLDGRRALLFFDEFGQLVKDKSFEDLIENKLVTIRKQDGFVIMGTQMPEQVTGSRIGPVVVQQTSTKIFLPNPEADRDQYINGFKLSAREFELIQSFGEKSRLCLIKQGSNSVVAEFRLVGFEDELAVLSGNTATSALAARLTSELGDDPAVWLPEFHRRRRSATLPHQPATPVSA